jgi:hypothetical protein
LEQNESRRLSQCGFILASVRLDKKTGTFKSASRKVPYTENLYRRTFDDEDHTMGRVGANAKVKLTNINAEFYRFG